MPKALKLRVFQDFAFRRPPQYLFHKKKAPICTTRRANGLANCIYAITSFQRLCLGLNLLTTERSGSFLAFSLPKASLKAYLFLRGRLNIASSTKSSAFPRTYSPSELVGIATSS